MVGLWNLPTPLTQSLYEKYDFFPMLAMMLVSTARLIYAQSSKELHKERQELSKASKRELNEKAGKEAITFLRKDGKRTPVRFLFKSNLTNQIPTDIKALIENTVANEQMDHLFHTVSEPK